jgi:hypothetical protein
MAISYTVITYDSAGTRTSYISDVLDVVVSRAVNGIDMARITVGGTSAAVQYLTYGSILEIYREDRDAGIAYYREFAGMMRLIDTVVADVTTVTVQAVGFAALLADRIVAWKSGVSNRSTFSASPAETILKTLFDYNLGSNATTANGRLLGGALTGATTTASGGAGNSLSISVAGQNLLTAMQRIQEAAGGDFDLVYTAPATYTYTWYTGQRGTNRSSTVIFSVANGTIGQLRIVTDRIVDATAAIVAGQGEGVYRSYVTRPASLPTGLNLRERWVDARNQSTTAEYQQLGDIVLAEAERQRSRIEVQILQSEALRYGRDYVLGDLVSVYTGSTTLTRKVQSVGLHFSSDGSEAVDVGLVTQ